MKLIKKVLHRWWNCENCGHSGFWHTPFGCVKCDCEDFD